MDLLGLSAYDSAEDERDDDEKDVNEDGKETRTNDISAIPSSLTISKEAHETKSIISHAEMVEMSSQTTGADSIKATAPDVVESKRRRLAFVHEIPNYLADAVPNEETVSTIRQYLDAQQLHDFSLTNVRQIVFVFELLTVYLFAFIILLLILTNSLTEHSVEEGVRQPVHPHQDHRLLRH